jgi:tetratricopeptide (TPR) repeat protein
MRAIMLHLSRWLIVCTVASLVIASTAAAQDSAWIGKKFMPKDGCKAMIENREIDIAILGKPFTVMKVNGAWLWIGRAWVKASDVVPLDQAAAYYTEFLRNNPTSSWAYRGRGIVWDQKGELDNALKDYTEAIRLDPQSAWAYGNRGLVWHRKGELDNALKDYTEAIRLNPQDAMAYTGRGSVWLNKKEFDNALKDYTEALRLDPQSERAYSGRAIVWGVKKEFDNALIDYQEAIRLDPQSPFPYNGRARLLATATEEKYRDGKRAIADARKACELSEWKIASFISTLAAAYAEAGNFDDAVKWQTKAQNLYSAAEESEWGFLLALYKSGKPYRDEPKK